MEEKPATAQQHAPRSPRRSAPTDSLLRALAGFGSEPGMKNARLDTFLPGYTPRPSSTDQLADYRQRGGGLREHSEAAPAPQKRHI